MEWEKLIMEWEKQENYDDDDDRPSWEICLPGDTWIEMFRRTEKIPPEDLEEWRMYCKDAEFVHAGFSAKDENEAKQKAIVIVYKELIYYANYYQKKVDALKNILDDVVGKVNDDLI